MLLGALASGASAKTVFTGKIISRDSLPIANVKILLGWEDDPATLHFRYDSAFTDSSGAYRLLNDSSAKTVFLEARKPGYRATSITKFALSDDNQDKIAQAAPYVLREASDSASDYTVLKAKVTFADGLTPASHARMSLNCNSGYSYPWHSRDLVVTTADENGEMDLVLDSSRYFLVDPFQCQEFFLHADMPGGLGAKSRTTYAANDAFSRAGYSLRLAPQPVIFGTIISEFGQPLANVKVDYLFETTSAHAGTPVGVNSSVSTYTDSNGTYEFSPPRTVSALKSNCRLNASHPKKKTKVFDRFNCLDFGIRWESNTGLTPMDSMHLYPLSIKTLDSSGGILPNVYVDIWDSTSVHSWAEMFHGSSGSNAIYDLTPSFRDKWGPEWQFDWKNDFVILATKGLYSSPALQGVVRIPRFTLEQKVNQFEVVLRAVPIIRGRIFHPEDHAPLSNVKIEYFASGHLSAPTYFTLTDSQGAYRFVTPFSLAPQCKLSWNSQSMLFPCPEPGTVREIDFGTPSPLASMRSVHGERLRVFPGTGQGASGSLRFDNPHSHCEIKVSDTRGSLLFQGTFGPGSHSLPLAGGRSQGLLLVQWSAPQGRGVFKIPVP